jgi:hypothetical protein
MTVDPRLLAVWDTATPGWSRAKGDYTFRVAHSSRDLGESVRVALPAGHLSPQWRP